MAAADNSIWAAISSAADEVTIEVELPARMVAAIDRVTDNREQFIISAVGSALKNADKDASA